MPKLPRFFQDYKRPEKPDFEVRTSSSMVSIYAKQPRAYQLELGTEKKYSKKWYLKFFKLNYQGRAVLLIDVLAGEIIRYFVGGAQPKKRLVLEL